MALHLLLLTAALAKPIHAQENPNAAARRIVAQGDYDVAARFDGATTSGEFDSADAQVERDSLGRRISDYQARKRGDQARGDEDAARSRSWPRTRPFSVPFGKFLGVAMLAIFGVLILFLIVQLFRSSVPRKALRIRETSPLSAEPRVDRPTTQFEDAIRAAEAGDFERASHLLLQWALAEVGKATHPLRPHETARAVLRKPALKTDWKKAIAPLIRLVEHCHFEGGTAQKEDFEHCLAEIEELRNEVGRPK